MITVIILRYLSTGARRQPLVPMADQPSYYEYQSQHNRLPVSVNKFRSTDGNVLIHSKDTKPVGFLQFLTTVLMAEMLRTNLMWAAWFWRQYGSEFTRNPQWPNDGNKKMCGKSKGIIQNICIKLMEEYSLKKMPPFAEDNSFLLGWYSFRCSWYWFCLGSKPHFTHQYA